MARLTLLTFSTLSTFGTLARVFRVIGLHGMGKSGNQGRALGTWPAGVKANVKGKYSIVSCSGSVA